MVYARPIYREDLFCQIYQGARKTLRICKTFFGLGLNLKVTSQDRLSKEEMINLEALNRLVLTGGAGENQRVALEQLANQQP